MQNEEQTPPSDETDPTVSDSGNPSTPTGESEADSGQNAESDDVPRLKKELAEAQDRLLRTQAELENFRKRSQREQDDARRFESFRLVRDLLPAIDGLDRAMKSAEQSGDLQSLQDGIQMVYNQFLDVLKAHSTEQIPAEGKAFDPNLHEALTQVPTTDVEPMTIVQVVETGYRLHDRVVRPARVIVACAPAE